MELVIKPIGNYGVVPGSVRVGPARARVLQRYQSDLATVSAHVVGAPRAPPSEGDSRICMWCDSWLHNEGVVSLSKGDCNTPVLRFWLSIA